MSVHDITRDGTRYIMEWHDATDDKPGYIGITEACDDPDGANCPGMHETYDFYEEVQ